MLTDPPPQQAARQGEAEGHQPDEQGGGSQGLAQIGQRETCGQGVQTGGQGQNGHGAGAEVIAGTGRTFRGGETLPDHFDSQIGQKAEGQETAHPPQLLTEQAAEEAADPGHADLKASEPETDHHSIPEPQAPGVDPAADGRRRGVHGKTDSQQKDREQPLTPLADSLCAKAVIHTGRKR